MTKPEDARKKGSTTRVRAVDFAGLSGFNEAMKKIAAVPKEEVERREQAERDAKEISQSGMG